MLEKKKKKKKKKIKTAKTDDIKLIRLCDGCMGSGPLYIEWRGRGLIYRVEGSLYIEWRRGWALIYRVEREGGGPLYIEWKGRGWALMYRVEGGWGRDMVWGDCVSIWIAGVYGGEMESYGRKKEK